MYHSHHLIRSTSFSPTSRDDGAAGQQVLGAVDLGRLAEDGRPALARRAGRPRPQRRVGRDARVAVGPAAVHAEDQLGRGCGERRTSLTPAACAAIAATPARTVFRMPPHSWMTERGHGLVGGQVAVRRAATVRGSISQPRPRTGRPATFGWLANPRRVRRVIARPRWRGPGRTRVVGERDDAVDVRVGVEHAAAELVGDQPRGRRRAVHRGDDADVVAGAPAAVGAQVAVERPGRSGAAAAGVTRAVPNS